MPPFETIGLKAVFVGQELLNGVAKANTAVLSLGANMIKTAQASVVMANATAKTNPAVKGVSTGINALNVVSNRAIGIQRQLGKSLIAMTGFSNRFGVSLLFGAQALTAFSAAFTISQASKYQDSLARIDILTNLTTADTEKLGKSILELSKTVPKSPEDLGAAAYQILSSGINDVDQAFELLQVSAQAATGLFTNTETVAKILTSTLEAYQGSGLDAIEVTNILIAAIREGRAEPEAFANELGNVIGIATNLGVTFDELSGSLAVLTNTGLPAAQAMTGIRGILNAINDPADSANEIFEQLGTSAKELRQNIREGGLISAFQKLAEAGGNNRQALAEFFPEIRGLNAFLSGFTNNLDHTAQVFGRIKNSAGATQNAFERAKQTFSTQAAILRNELNVALINLGTQILPTLTKAIQDLLGWIEKNREELSAFAQDAIRVGARLGSAFITTIKAIIELTQVIGGNKATLTALAVSLVVVASAIAPIPVAIAVLITSIGLLIQNWDKLKNATIDAWNSIPNVIQDAIEFIATDVVTRVRAIVNGILLPFRILRGSLRIIMDLVRGDFGKAWDDFKNLASNVAKNVVDVIIGQFGILPNVLISIAETAINGFISVLEAGLRHLAKLPDPLGLLNISEDINLPEVKLPRVNVAAIPGISKEAADAIDKQTSSTKKSGEEAKETANIFDRLKDTLKDEAIGADGAKKATDALSDGVITFAEAAELGIDAITAGAREATVVLRDTEEEAFNFTKALSKIANAFNVSTQAANKLVLSLAREALAKVAAAQSALFGQPTREVAQAQADIAELNLKRAEVAARVVPQIEALQDELDRLNQIDTIKKGEEPTTQTVAAVIQQGLEGGMGGLNQAAGLTADELDKLKDNVQDKIDVLQRELDLVDRDIGAIQRRVDIYQAESDILQARILLENKTLLTQEEQRKKAEELAVQMGIASGEVVKFARAVGEDPIEAFNEMNRQMALLADAVKIANDPTFRQQFIPAAETAASKLNDLAGKTQDLTNVFTETIDRIKGLFDFAQPGTVAKTKELFGADIFQNPVGRQHGGLITSPEIARLHPPELILPLKEPTRSRELLQSLPSFAAAVTKSNQMSGSLFGDIVVNGQSWEDNRRMIHTEIDRRLDQQRRGFHRQGL